MQFARVTNQMLLGAVAFGVSFCVTFVVNRDVRQAGFTGLITVPATYSATMLINLRRIKQGKRLVNSLEAQVLELEEYKIDLNQFIGEVLAEEQEVEASIYALQGELDHLRIKLSQGYNQKKEQNWELYILQNQKQQQEAEVSSLKKHINALENQIKSLTQELNQIELSKKLENQKNEANRELLKFELSQLQSQIIEQQNEKRLREQESLNIDQEVRQLLAEKQTIKANLDFLQMELCQLQAQVTEKQNEKTALEQGLFYFEEQRRQLVEGLHNLKVEVTPSRLTLPLAQRTELPDEWKEFLLKLPDYEFLVLKAIVEQDNPSTAIKSIAQENLTMPEVLIDSINERAIDTLDDLIIDSSSSSEPRIRDEYLEILKSLIGASY